MIQIDAEECINLGAIKNSVRLIEEPVEICNAGDRRQDSILQYWGRRNARFFHPMFFPRTCYVTEQKSKVTLVRHSFFLSQLFSIVSWRWFDWREREREHLVPLGTLEILDLRPVLSTYINCLSVNPFKKGSSFQNMISPNLETWMEAKMKEESRSVKRNSVGNHKSQNLWSKVDLGNHIWIAFSLLPPDAPLFIVLFY